MQIAEFGPVKSLKLVSVTDPKPRPHEVVVAVHAAPVNFVDTLVVSGAYQFLPPLPFTPGKGPAGVVAAVGSEVTKSASW